MCLRNYDLSIVVTVTGMRYQQNPAIIFDSKSVKLVKEPQNKHDHDAVAVYDEFGKLGYVANSSLTMEKGSASATMLSKAMPKRKAYGRLFLSDNGRVLCRVDGVYNPDLVCEKAIEKYNEKRYDLALSLFLKIQNVFDTAFLLSCIADCYLRLGDKGLALKYADAAIKKSPNEELALKVKFILKENN